MLAAHGEVDFLEARGSLASLGLARSPEHIPGGGVGEVFIIALGFAIGVLMLGAEVTAAALFTVEGILAEEFGELHEVGHATGSSFRIRGVAEAGDDDVVPELFAEFGDFAEGFFEAGFVAGHAALVPTRRPSSRWKLSTLRLPLLLRKRLVRAFSLRRAFWNSGWLVVTLPGVWVTR